MNTTVTRYDTAFYVQALDRFVATGECAETDTEPLYAYLLSVMNDSMVKVQVLGDEVCARIFYDTMIQFIQLNLEKERYNLRKSQSERTGMKLVLEWSMAKRKDGWQALLQQISDKYREYGFDSRFYRSHFGTEGGYADDEVWEKMVDDWEDAFQLKMHEEKEKEIAFRKDALERRLRSNLKDIPEYIRQNRVDKDEFFQTWGMMSGLWNTVDFERIRKIVRIQRSCPEIVKVARKMGRMADDEGREQIRIMDDLNAHIKKWRKETNIGFALYGTPAENLTNLFCKIDKARFGSIPDVTDKGYYTNSYHVDVREPINVFDKFSFEADFEDKSTGGCISYAEIPNMTHNIPAVLTMVQYIYDHIAYGEFNTKLDYCHECGFDGEIILNDDNEWECPRCHNKDRNKLTVIRRTCGYLGENFWNEGRTQEIKNRVLHI